MLGLTGFFVLYCGLFATHAPNSVEAQGLEWRVSADLPEPRDGYASGVLDGRLVIAGGDYWEGSKGHWTKKRFSRSTHAFDPRRQLWERLPDMPMPLGYAASAVVGGKLFVMGGYTGQAVNRRILTLGRDGESYVWRVYGELPVDRLFAKAMSVAGTIFLVGGSTRFEPLDTSGTCCLTTSATRSFMVLDTTTAHPHWRYLAQLPGANLWAFSATTDGDSIWVFGGVKQSRRVDAPVVSRDVRRYRLQTNEWERTPDLPDLGPRSVSEDRLVSAVWSGGTILLIGSTHAWTLDPATLKYSELPPLPRQAFVDSFVWLQDVIVGAGGESRVESPGRRSPWTFIGRLH